jgi:hypothetical protein
VSTADGCCAVFGATIGGVDGVINVAFSGTGFSGDAPRHI